MAREYSQAAIDTEKAIKDYALKTAGVAGPEIDAFALIFKNMVDDFEAVKAALGVNNT
jgi:hypothetical protein